MREPRNGRTFEYRGEDPVLAGVMAGNFLVGLQNEHVIGDIKHFAVNDQETGRQVNNPVMSHRVLRESDLMAFEIGVKIGNPGMVMCSYNLVNGDYACENDYLLNQVLKRDWQFKGFVLSDWGGAHSTAKAMNSGLDQEQPDDKYFGERLAAAVAAGEVPQSRIDDAALRIVRTLFASGVVDNPPVTMVVDIDGGLEISQMAAENGMVLLKNNGELPIAATAKSILLVGSHADVGVLTGGGSGQVDPPGGSAVKAETSVSDQGAAGVFSRGPIWYPSSPLKALKALRPDANIIYDSGNDPQKSAELAKTADLVIVFANKPAGEAVDLPDLSLPGNQDGLIKAIATANKHTVVVLETGGPITMPWLDLVGGVIQAWYPGARGGEAMARLMTGKVNFSAKLPISFPRSIADLPNPVLPGSTLKTQGLVDETGAPVMDSLGRQRVGPPPFDITYPEGANVGYRWYELKKIKPIFGFGFGLSYTSYGYEGLSVSADTVHFTVKNTGAFEGIETAQVYAQRPGDVDGSTRRLVGWTRIPLKTGEKRTVDVKIDPMYISTFDEKANAWVLKPGKYTFFVGRAANDTPLSGSISVLEP
ncbi:hypothetical protein ABENE_15530 [Asticcacaulis benevestitus DSM 16100 = ATCC BAA-896]|uniref:Fibronectin type III-like domain-containing protein n=2 Tax=Asticcacaulis TaxID=76890 RepID=V4PKB7_9CAUL|nr:hypothetical protein ABENE_15530 [Asticcacaulis benevestitus DSM 16100 = ATCC BAA-896]